ncbi:MAG: ATP synthase F0 subunit C [Candidatus Margulisiibacteriota bacterium]|jgi:F0F1-type ATP synthase membrane subunit c/vacuolar-type H+-ATPase subunit K
MDVNLLKLGSMLGAGIGMGFGAMGAGLGEGMIAGSANKALERQPGNYGNILKMMLIGQAVAETTSIFAILIALIMLFQKGDGTIISFFSHISAGIAIGVGTLGAGLGGALPAAASCEAVAREPHVMNKVMMTMLVGQAVTQSSAIYAMVIALILIFLV